MKLHALCHYRSKSDEWTEKWRSEDYNARNLIKALKRKPFNGRSGIKVGDQTFQITDSAAGQAAALQGCALALARRIQQAGYREAAMVPVPASDHVDPDKMFTGRRLAEAIEAVAPGLVCYPILYFDQVLPSAALGGTRNAYEIKRHLRCTDQELDEDNVILLDDVCTSGGHLRGTRLFLVDRQYEVNDAFVVGRTVWQRPESMFSVPVEKLC